MSNENDLAALYLESLNETLENFRKGENGSKQKMLMYMQKYLNLEKQHIQKEQLFILPLCNQEIEKQDKLLTQFRLCDEKEFGVGMQEKFHESFAKIIDSMKEHYFSEN
jgi:Uncharacterized conserved protein